MLDFCRKYLSETDMTCELLLIEWWVRVNTPVSVQRADTS